MNQRTEIPLNYRDADGTPSVIEGCNLMLDAHGRYWLWCDALEMNIAYKTKSVEDTLKAAIDSLLFTISLRNDRIAQLQRVANLAEKFSADIAQLTSD